MAWLLHGREDKYIPIEDYLKTSVLMMRILHHYVPLRLKLSESVSEMEYIYPTFATPSHTRKRTNEMLARFLL